MDDLDLDCSVPDLLIDHPQLFAYFRELALDYSCGGKSLRTACRERGLNPSEVLAECYSRLRQRPDPTAADTLKPESRDE
jgi:regulator of cell morphogenesis and NO signaling